MTTSEKISEAFNNLAHLSSQVYDYWISELYLGDEMISSAWNEETLALMERDVENLYQEEEEEMFQQYQQSLLQF